MDEEHGRPKFDTSWAAWKDRLGIAAVLVSLALLFFFMFVDASLNFQCSVTDFITMKCNRFDRKFIPWDQLDKQRGTSWHAPLMDQRTTRLQATAEAAA